MIADKHIEALTALLGTEAVSTDPNEIAPHLVEWRDKFKGRCNLLVKPQSLKETAAFVRYCNDHFIPVVPQGGNTGLVGGGIPGLDGRAEILFSSKRMLGDIVVDPNDMTLTAGAGVTLAAMQEAAANHNLLFPLSLASEGSCTAGGIISTNAGGMHVIRYGNTRALTLGLEAVLPNGTIIDSMSGLKKDNTGYDLKQLLIGAEGSLGIVTKARFKLVPPENNRITLWLGADIPSDSLDILQSLQSLAGPFLSVFEILPQTGLDMVLSHIPGTRAPLGQKLSWHMLIELGTADPDYDLNGLINPWLEKSMDRGVIVDGMIARSGRERAQLWKLRESMSEAQKFEGGSIKHDIAVPVSTIPAFLETATAAVTRAYPGTRPVPFGHMGDGNLHFNIMQPKDANRETFLGNWQDMNQLIHDIVAEFGGSISAEHGIGTLKREELARVKNTSELQAMRAIKAALDPNSIMNPGVLFV